MLKIDNLW